MFIYRMGYYGYELVTVSSKSILIFIAFKQFIELKNIYAQHLHNSCI
jgi:hypothetical protein